MMVLLRKGLIWVAGFFFLTYLTGVGDRVFEGLGWYSTPLSTENLNTLRASLRAVVESKWFEATCLFIVAFALGMLFDSFTERLSRKRLEKIKSLGASSVSLGGAIRNSRAMGQSDDGITNFYGPRIASVLHGFRKAGLPTPQQGTVDQTIQYLRGVGQLLQDGHVEEAKNYATDLLGRTEKDRLLRQRFSKTGSNKWGPAKQWRTKIEPLYAD